MLNRGKASVTIESIVDDLPSINYKQVLYEAITNSIQADATKIEIKFIYNILNFDKKDIKENEKILESLEIIDNGIGFIDKNIEAFKEYKTKNKFALGCKGVGRFLYLKLFEKVEIKSLDKKIDFIINRDIQATQQDKKIDKTIVKLSKAKKKFVIDYQNLKNDLQEHFIAYFKLLKDKNRTLEIIVYKDKNKSFNINSNDIPNFIEYPFQIKNHKFMLNYIFNDNSLPNEGYYCAGKRVVKKNSELESKKKIKFFKQFNLLFLLESTYLDENVKSDTRDDFTIYPKRRNDDEFSNLAWDEIQRGVKEQIKIIAKENNIEIDKLAKEHLREAIKESPFLVYYLKGNELGEDSESLQKQAKKLFEKDKQFLRNTKNQTHEKYKEKLAIVTQSELTEYVYDRQKKIDLLKKLTDEKALEKEIHNLFMQQRTSDKKEDYRTNNLWLFDDRFMTYDKIFSEAQIKDIFPNLIANTKRPDILSLSIVSNSYNQEEITDIVIIELKRPNENIEPSGAETQLLRYSRYINESRANNKIRIWTYAFLKFNEETEFDLDNRSYNKIPIHGEYPIYYRYYEKPNTIINFLDYRAMAIDANNRNKTFMKILSGITIFE